jgi:hypothetical protein
MVMQRIIRKEGLAPKGGLTTTLPPTPRAKLVPKAQSTTKVRLSPESEERLLRKVNERLSQMLSERIGQAVQSAMPKREGQPLPRTPRERELALASLEPRPNDPRRAVKEAARNHVLTYGEMMAETAERTLAALRIGRPVGLPNR